MPSDSSAWRHLWWQSSSGGVFQCPTPLQITPFPFSIWRHHTLMNREQEYLCSRWTWNCTGKSVTRHFQLVEILFAMVSFAMYTTFTLHGVMNCKVQHLSRGHHWRTISRRSEKDHSLKITETFLQQRRQYSIWFRLCFTGFLVSRLPCTSITACHTNRQSHHLLGRGD